MFPPELSPRKVKRKIQSDGVVSTGVAAADLLTREWVGRYLFDSLVKHDWVQTLSRSELRERSTSLVEITENHQQVPSPFVAQLPSGYILTETGLLLTQAMKIIEESAAHPEQVQQPMMAMSSRELFFGKFPAWRILTNTPPSYVDTLKTVASLIPRYPTNYYHWMIEVVPKIRYLKKFEKQTDTEVTILVPSNPQSFIIDTLNLLNWPNSKITSTNKQIIRAQNLIIPSTPQLNPRDFEWIRNKIIRQISTNKNERGVPSSQKNNVYISRANAISRRVRNEDAVMDVLTKYGFERYYLEERSLAENARLFSNADIIVGPHGAGLTDIIFTEDCALVELFGTRRNMAYKKLSGTIGVKYEPIYCEANGPDIVVDTKELENRVEALVNEVD